MGPTWVLSAPDGPHAGPMDLAIRATSLSRLFYTYMGSSFISTPTPLYWFYIKLFAKVLKQILFMFFNIYMKLDNFSNDTNICQCFQHMNIVQYYIILLFDVFQVSVQHITMMPYKPGVWNHGYWVNVQELVQTSGKESIKVLHWWPFVRRIHQWQRARNIENVSMSLNTQRTQHSCGNYVMNHRNK